MDHLHAGADFAGSFFIVRQASRLCAQGYERGPQSLPTRIQRVVGNVFHHVHLGMHLAIEFSFDFSDFFANLNKEFRHYFAVAEFNQCSRVHGFRPQWMQMFPKKRS